ncbi:RNA-directed DNA polymerase from mobile element jockey [Trichonephila clavipes]|nr:RNA-directed DNA polymerase from mobile element jockey [Trichonephila clavipes]
MAGESPILSIGWWYLSSVSPKRHCYRVSAADKGWRVYPLDPRPDAVALYSACTPGKRRAWFWPDDQHPASLVGLRGGWRHARTKLYYALMDPSRLCTGKGFVLPNLNIDVISKHSRFLILSLPDNDMMKKSQFAIHKALIQVGGEPKSVKRLRSGDLIIEASSALQTKFFFLLAKSFLDSPLTLSPHKSLNTSRGVVSEPDLLSTPETEILDGFSDQGVIQLPSTIKAGYLNCKIRPYIPNPLRCFNCQSFGHSQTSCRGQLTCSRCASAGHSSTECHLEPKCINNLQPHPSDSKVCSK